jgi:hypothetical protein
LERSVGIPLGEAGVAEASDRGSERIERGGPWLDHALDHRIVQMAEDQPLRAARGSDERAKEVGMEAFRAKPRGGRSARADDQIPGSQASPLYIRV